MQASDTSVKFPVNFSSIQDLKEGYEKLRATFIRFRGDAMADDSDLPSSFASEQALKEGYENLRVAFINAMSTAGVGLLGYTLLKQYQ
jgi:hypothetical protein